MTYYDYAVVSDTTTVTTITDTSSNGGTSYTRTIHQDVYAGTNLTANPTSSYVYDANTDNRSSMKIYNHANSGKKYSVEEMINQTALAISDSKLSTAVLIEFRIAIEGGDTFTDTTKLIMKVDPSLTGGVFFTYNNTATTGGYQITISAESGTLTIYIIDYENTYSLKVYNAVTGNTSTTSVSNVVVINGVAVTVEGQIIP